MHLQKNGRGGHLYPQNVWEPSYRLCEKNEAVNEVGLFAFISLRCFHFAAVRVITHPRFEAIWVKAKPAEQGLRAVLYEATMSVMRLTYTEFLVPR